jgi:hypothetical protein
MRSLTRLAVVILSLSPVAAQAQAVPIRPDFFGEESCGNPGSAGAAAVVRNGQLGGEGHVSLEFLKSCDKKIGSLDLTLGKAGSRSYGEATYMHTRKYGVKLARDFERTAAELRFVPFQSRTFALSLNPAGRVDQEKSEKTAGLWSHGGGMSYARNMGALTLGTSAEMSFLHGGMDDVRRVLGLSQAYAVKLSMPVGSQLSVNAGAAVSSVNVKGTTTEGTLSRMRDTDSKVYVGGSYRFRLPE